MFCHRVRSGVLLVAPAARLCYRRRRAGAAGRTEEPISPHEYQYIQRSLSQGSPFGRTQSAPTPRYPTSDAIIRGEYDPPPVMRTAGQRLVLGGSALFLFRLSRRGRWRSHVVGQHPNNVQIIAPS